MGSVRGTLGMDEQVVAVGDDPGLFGGGLAALPMMPRVVREADPAANSGRKEVMFIASNVADWQALVEGAKPGVEVVLLHGSADGLAQIATWATLHSSYDSVHIFSHGSQATIELGTNSVSNARLSDVTVTTALTALGRALNADGDLLLYGCDIAAGDTGATLINELAMITGADVAASDDKTGIDTKGGNWELEKRTGMVETEALKFFDDYDDVLSSPPASSNFYARPYQVGTTWTVPTSYFSVSLNANIPSVKSVTVTKQPTKGIIEYSTNNGSTWSNMLNVWVTPGNLVRYRDIAGDPATNESSGFIYWIGNAGENNTEQIVNVADNPASGLSQNTYDIWGAAGSGIAVAKLALSDTGLLPNYGLYVIESQSSPNLFSLSGTSTVSPAVVFDSGTLPAAGQTASLTVRYYDYWQLDSSGTPIAGQGYSSTITFTVRENPTGFAAETHANSTTANSQSSAAVTALSDGSYVAVWRSVAQGSDTGTNGGIYAQRYSSTGAKVGSEFAISNQGIDKNESAPAIAALQNGKFLVAYQQNNTTPDVVFRIVGADNALSAETVAHSSSSGNQTSPAAAAMSNGNFAISWQDSTSTDVYSRLFDSTGAAIASSEMAVTTTTGTQSAPSVAALSNGNCAVVWRDPANNGEVVGRVMSATGGVSSEFTVASGPAYQTSPKIAALNGGGFVVVFQESGNTEGSITDLGGSSPEYNIYGRIYNDAGTAQSAKFLVNASAQGSQIGPSVSALGNGGFIVSWSANTDPSSGRDIFARRFDASGTASDSYDLLINEASRSGDQTVPAVSPLGTTGFTVSWTDANGDGPANAGILNRAFLATASGPVITNSTPADNATGVATTANPAIGFSKTIAFGASGTITLYNITTNAVAESWDVSVASKIGSGDGQISISGDTLTLNPTGTLKAGTQYSVRFTAGSIVDTAATPNQLAAITDNTAYNFTTASPTVTLSVNNTNIAEAAGATTVTATLSAAASTDTTVTLTPSGTATGNGTDYSLSSTTIAIAAGQTTGTATITAVQDSLDEADEAVILDINAVSGGGGATENNVQQVAATIIDDDPTPGLSVADVSLAEGNAASANLTFTVTLSAASGRTVTVNHATTNGTATAGSDYTAASGTLVFDPGETTKTFAVAITGDTAVEANETFTVTLSNATNATIATATATATATITNDDAAPPSITGATYDVATGSLVVTGANLTNGGTIDGTKLTLSGEGGETHTLTATGAITASSSTQFTITLNATDQAAVNQILNKAGTTSTGGAPFTLAAAADWHGTGSADAAGTGVTVSNVPAPAISSATYDASTGTLVVTGTGFLKLNGANNDIDVSKLSLTDQGGNSHTLTSPSVEISSGTVFSVTLSAADRLAVNGVLNTSGIISAAGTPYTLVAAEDWAAGAVASAVVADAVGNGVTVSNVTAPTITSATYDASTGVLTVGGTNLVAAPGAANDITVSKLTLTGEGATTHTLTTSNVEVTSATSFSMTLNAADKAAVDLILNKNGTTSTGGTPFNLAAADDWNTVITGGDIADPTNRVTVTTVPVPAITSATYDAATGVLTVTGTGFTQFADGNDIDVSKLTLVGDGSNHTLTSGGVEIASGTSFTVTLNATDKNALASVLNKNGPTSSGNVVYTLSAAEDWARGADAAVVIADTTGNAITVSGANAAPMVDLNGAAGANATASFNEGTHQGTGDTSGVPIAPGGLLADSDGTIDTVTVTLTGQGDTGERLLVPATVSPASGLTVAGSGTSTITIARGTATTADVQAALQSIRYQNNSDTPNTTSRTITVTATDNGGSQSSETVSVSVAASNDAPTTLRLDGAVTDTVNQSAGANAAVGTLSVSDPDGGAPTYTLVSGTGDTNNGLFTISGTSLRAANAGTMAAGAYSVRVQANDGAGDVVQQAMTITVVDDVVPMLNRAGSRPADAATGVGVSDNLVLTFSETVAAGVSGTTIELRTVAGAAVETFTSNGTAFTSSAGGTATLSGDTLTLNPGATLLAGTAYSVRLAAGVLVDGANHPLAAITDDMAYTFTAASPTVTLGVSTTAPAENGAVVTVTATLSAAAGSDTTVTLTPSGTATGGTDYTLSSPTITIAAGQTTGTATVTLNDDALNEDAETVILDITNVSGGGGATESGTQQRTITIADDDPMPTVNLSTAPGSASESGGSATITATLSAASSKPVTIALTLTGTAIGSGTDYSITGTAITISAGQTTGTVTLTGLNDALVEGNETVIATLGTLTNAMAGATTAVTVTVTDDDVPSVTLTALTPPPTNADSVEFLATFSTAPDNAGTVDAADFAVVAGTGVTTGMVTVSDHGDGDAKTFKVTVAGVTGNGTLGLNFVDDDSVTVSGVGMGGNGVSNGNVTGPVLTIDTAAPTVIATLTTPTNDTTPELTVSVTDAGVGVANGTAVAVDVDLNNDGDFLDAGEANHSSGTITAGAATIALAALGEGSYTVQARVADALNNAGTSMAQSVVVDTTKPTATLTPADGATGVGIGADLVLSFDTAVQKGTGTIVVRKVADDSIVETLDVTSSAVTVSGSTVIVNPAADLAYATEYYLILAGGAILDLAGNAYDGLTKTGSAYDYNFTTASPPPPSTPVPVTKTVDGVQVQTGTTTNSDGTTTQTVVVPVVTTARPELVGNNTVADIPLVTTSLGGSLLTAQVPTGYGLQVSGTAAPKAAGASLTDLIREIKAHTAEGSEDQNTLTGGGSGFLQGLSADTPLIVQTLVPTVAPGSTSAPGTPLVIAGTPAAAGGPQTALVIDTRGLPSGSAIQLQNVEFAAVIGAVTVTGGEGSQSVWGDGATQTILLGADDDTLHGGGGDDFVGSRTGNDVLYGEDGTDTVQGGEEHDRLFGNTGSDLLFGNSGADTLYGGKGEDLLHGGRDDDRLSGDLGADTLSGDQGSDVLFGGLSDGSLADGSGDRLFGNGGADVLFGNAGADTLHGGQEADTLYGGLDDDLLFGDKGDDVLWGDHGNDTLTGGAGADLFRFSSGSGRDVITDFNAAEGDRLQLAEGQGYSLRNDTAGNAVIVFSSDDELVLRGITQAQVQAGWFVTG